MNAMKLEMTQLGNVKVVTKNVHFDKRQDATYRSFFRKSNSRS